MTMLANMLAAAQRLLGYYNGNDYSADNPGGMTGVGGMATNWDPCIQDIGTVANGVGEVALATAADREAIAADRDAAHSDRLAADEAAEAAQTWADGVEPGGPGTKSSMGWAGDAEGSAERAEQAAASIAGGPVPSARKIGTSGSLTGGHDLSADLTLSLLGDVANPGPLKVYGTDANGNRGFLAIDAAGGSANVGGAASAVLTASSARVQNVAFTADYLSLTLPDARTLGKGGPVYVLRNTGKKSFTVRTSGGAILGALSPYGVAYLFLSDNSTAVGTWSVIGTDWYDGAVTRLSSALPNVNNFFMVRPIDGTRALVLFKGSNPTGLWAVVYNVGAGTFGTAVLVTSDPSWNSAASSFKQSSNSAGIGAFDVDASRVLLIGATSSRIGAVVLSIAGAVITVGTMALGGSVVDVISGVPIITFPICQLAPNKYAVNFYASAGAFTTGVLVGTGTNVSVGAGIALHYNAGSNVYNSGYPLKIDDNMVLSLFSYNTISYASIISFPSESPTQLVGPTATNFYHPTANGFPILAVAKHPVEVGGAVRVLIYGMISGNANRLGLVTVSAARNAITVAGAQSANITQTVNADAYAMLKYVSGDKFLLAGAIPQSTPGALIADVSGGGAPALSAVVSLANVNYMMTFDTPGGIGYMAATQYNGTSPIKIGMVCESGGLAVFVDGGFPLSRAGTGGAFVYLGGSRIAVVSSNDFLIRFYRVGAADTVYEGVLPVVAGLGSWAPLSATKALTVAASNAVGTLSEVELLA